MNGVQTIALTLKRGEIQFDVNKGAQNLLDFLMHMFFLDVNSLLYDYKVTLLS